MKQQYILNEHGKAIFVVVPIDEYNLLQEYKAIATSEDEDEGNFIDIPYTKGDNDNETFPNEVVNIMVAQEVSLLAAWRLYRGLSQSEVATKTGLTQSAISQAERQGSKPQMKTLERLAKVYDCRPTQLYLDE